MLISFIGYCFITIPAVTHLVFESNEKQFKSRIMLSLIGIAIMLANLK